MSNFIKDTFGKVTQSVASAVVVTLVTTYVLVDLGKKKNEGEAAKSDTVKVQTTPQSMSQPDGRSSAATERKQNRDVPKTEGKQIVMAGQDQAAEVRKVANETFKELDEEETKTAVEKEPVQPKHEPGLVASKSRADTVAKEKQVPRDVKQVQKRAEDVFDELDEEVSKRPPR